MDIRLKHGITYNTNKLQFYKEGEVIHKNDVVDILKDKYETRVNLLENFFDLGQKDDKTKSPLFMKNVGKEILTHFPH